jgi:hypothetical protein
MGGYEEMSLDVSNESLWNLNDASLTFNLYPGSPSTTLLRNLSTSIEVPVNITVSEPSTFVIFGLGIMGLVFRRFKKQS